MILPNNICINIAVCLLGTIGWAILIFQDLRKLRAGCLADAKWQRIKKIQMACVVIACAFGLFGLVGDHLYMLRDVLFWIVVGIAIASTLVAGFIEDSYIKFRRRSNIEGIRMTEVEAQVDKGLNQMTKGKWILIAVCIVLAFIFIFVVAGIRF